MRCDDSQQAERYRPVLLDDHGIYAVRDRDDPHLWETFRPVREETGIPRRTGTVRCRVPADGHVRQHGDDDRMPRPAGSRRRDPDTCATAAVADLYEPAKRARMQGILGPYSASEWTWDRSSVDI